MTPDRRVLLLVLDGLGIGASLDAPESDREANTLRHIEEVAGALELPTLRSVGLGEVSELSRAPSSAAVRAAYGKTQLGYAGADTFLGHQTLMGSVPDMALHLLADVRAEVVSALVDSGYNVESLTDTGLPLVVDGAAVVADNVEARRGLSINVTASLDAIDFESLLAIGRVVRKTVKVPRVIVVAGRGFDVGVMRRHLSEPTSGQIGVDTPGMGVYDEHYQVRQLGASSTGRPDLPALVRDGGGSVVLLGKAADVINCDGAIEDPIVLTREVLATAQRAFAEMSHGLLVANVQETDLAGHEQDPHRFARVLEEVDGMLPSLIDDLNANDLLVITADHGNDPTNGSSQHTREDVPVLIVGERARPGRFADRTSLADVGSTIARFLALPELAIGAPLGEDVLRCS